MNNSSEPTSKIEIKHPPKLRLSDPDQPWQKKKICLNDKVDRYMKQKGNQDYEAKIMQQWAKK